jgi:hypothetical protein
MKLSISRKPAVKAEDLGLQFLKVRMDVGHVVVVEGKSYMVESARVEDDYYVLDLEPKA